MDQSELLSTLARAEPGAVKLFAEELIPLLEPIQVLSNRTGLAMLPARESAAGAHFYLGEVLLAEARVRAAGAEGYGACLGRDLEQALAIALIDAALAAGVAAERIRRFAAEQAAILAEADAALLAQVEQTKVDLETF